MSNEETHGAEGKLYLEGHWEESSSGHVENSHDFHLEAAPDGKNVILVKIRETKKFIGPSVLI